MKRFISIMLFCLVVFGVSTGLAVATTTTSTGKVISVTDIDSTWNYLEAFPSAQDGVQVWAIYFLPGASNDHFIVREASATGPIIAEGLCNSTHDQRVIKLGGLYFKPYLDFDIGTYSTGSELIIILQETPY